MDDQNRPRARRSSNRPLHSNGEAVRRSRLNSSPAQSSGNDSSSSENLWSRSVRKAQEERRKLEAQAREKAEAEQKAKAKEQAKARAEAGGSASRPSVRNSDRPGRRRASSRSTVSGTGSATRSARADRGSAQHAARRSSSTPRTTVSMDRDSIDTRPAYQSTPRSHVEEERTTRRSRQRQSASTREGEGNVMPGTRRREVISSVEPERMNATDVPFQAVADERGIPIATAEGAHRGSWGSREQIPGMPSRGGKGKFIILAVIVVVLLVVVGSVARGILFANAAEGNGSASQKSEQPLSASDKEATEEQVSAATTQTLTVSFCGDCTLGTDETFDYGSSFNAAYESKGDPSWFFANVASIFAADDLTVANMEGTLTTATSRADKTFAFKGDASYAQVLVKGNVDAASLANNHSHDYGDQSYEDTITNMEAAGIPTFGYDRIAYMDVKGVKVGLIGTYVLDQGDAVIPSMEANIKKAQEEGAQLIAVFTHWGTELDDVPDSTQTKIAHAAIDAGAHLVVGSHPHVIQGLEKYNGRYIVYSLGNFCFGGNQNPTDPDCMIFQQTFQVNGTDVAQDDQVTVIPCSVSSESGTNNYQPTPAEGDEKARIQSKIDDRTAAIGDSLKK